MNLILNERECNFGLSIIDILGLWMFRLGLRTLAQKIEAIHALPFPSPMKQLRHVLGQFSYYRQFIPRFASIAEPLTCPLKAPDKDSVIHVGAKQRARRVGWQSVASTPNRLAGFHMLKSLLCSAPVLCYPDFKRPFLLYTDASKVGVGAPLQQECLLDGWQHPVLFISRSLTPAEKHYSATELVYLRVYWSFNKLSHYLDGSSCTVITDYQALQWQWSITQSTNSRLHKWDLLLGPMEGKIKIVHRLGLAYSHVDPILRTPILHTFISLIVTPDLSERIRLSYATDDDFGGYVNNTPDGPFHWDSFLLFHSKGSFSRLCNP